MIRIIFGFVLGCLATYHSYPFVKSVMQSDVVAHAESLFSLNEETTTINPTPPITVQQKNQIKIHLDEANEMQRLLKSINLASSSPSNSPASDFVIDLIKSLVTKDPSLSGFIRARIEDGIDNKEALEIFNQHVNSQL